MAETQTAKFEVDSIESVRPNTQIVAQQLVGYLEGLGVEGVMIRNTAELEPANRNALKSGVLTVIQVRTGHAPTPTPGHWDINSIIRKPNSHSDTSEKRVK